MPNRFAFQAIRMNNASVIRIGPGVWPSASQIAVKLICEKHSPTARVKDRLVVRPARVY
jgi:hypothetical protein